MRVDAEGDVVETHADEPYPDEEPRRVTRREHRERTQQDAADGSDRELHPNQAPTPRLAGGTPHVRRSQSSYVEDRHDLSSDPVRR
jgi:hypothetical protein